MEIYNHIDHAGVIRTIVTKSNNPKIVECALRKKLNKDLQYEDWCRLFKHANLTVPTCNICKKMHVPFYFIIDVKDSFVKISDVVTPKQYSYCYGKSSQCREMSRGRKMNPNSARFISLVMEISEDDARSWIRNNNKSNFYRENFSSNDQYRASQTRDLEWHKIRYGEAAGFEKYENLIKKQNHSRSLAGYVEKYGDLGQEAYVTYCRSKDSMTLDSFRARNPGIEEQSLIDLWRRRAKSVGLTKSAFIEKHGIEGYLACLSSRRAGRTKVSKWSLGLIDILLKNHLDKSQVIEVRYGLGNEICIHDVENRRSYYYDFYIKLQTGRKLVIEFNGCMFHADPRIEPSKRHEWKTPFNPDLTWERMFEYDERKLEVAKMAEFETLVVWDYESEEQIIKKVGDFILGK